MEPDEYLAPWQTPSHLSAALEIWEMVDELLDDGRDDHELVSAGAPDDKKSGRGWRRGKKG